MTLARNTRRGLMRLGIQLLLLGALFAINFYDEDLFFGVVGVALLLVPPINWTVAGILIWTSRQAPHVESLRERADDAITLSLVSTAAAVAGAVAILRVLGFTIEFGRPVIVLLAFGLILVAIPALDWLKTWRDVWLPMLYDGGSAPSRGHVENHTTNLDNGRVVVQTTVDVTPAPTTTEPDHTGEGDEQGT